MINSYELPNYWTWKIYLCHVKGEDTFQNVLEFYNENEDCHFDLNMQGGIPSCIVDKDAQTVVVCIDNWEFNPYKIGLLAHETVHLLIAISDGSGCEINIHTNEVWAYSMNTFIETFIKILNNEKEQKC